MTSRRCWISRRAGTRRFGLRLRSAAFGIRSCAAEECRRERGAGDRGLARDRGGVSRTRGGVVARARGEDGQEQQFQAKFLVDASGRDTLLATKFATKVSNRRHHSAAVLRPLHRRAAPARQGGGQYQPVLVRSRLVLVHSAAGRHHQCRRGLPRGFHQGAQDRCDHVLQERDRHVAGAVGPAERRGNDRSGDRDRQLLVQIQPSFPDRIISWSATPTVSSIRCSRPAFCSPCRADSSPPTRSPPACTSRRPRRSACFARYEADVNRAMVRFSWFIYRDQPSGDPLVVHGATAIPVAHAGGGVVAAGGRRVPPIADPCPAGACSKDVYYLKISRRGWNTWWRGTGQAGGEDPARHDRAHCHAEHGRSSTVIAIERAHERAYPRRS